MKTKQKCLGILLAICMALMLVPITAFAADDAAFEVIDTEGNATQYAVKTDPQNCTRYYSGFEWV